MCRDLTVEMLEVMAQEQLVRITESPDESSKARAAARMALIRRFACNDCGAGAGRECKPDYGCTNSSRCLSAADAEFAEWVKNDIYLGSHFNIARRAHEWMLWRIADDEGNREHIVLGQHGMDDLHAYFADLYVEDRAAAREEIAAQREP